MKTPCVFHVTKVNRMDLEEERGYGADSKTATDSLIVVLYRRNLGSVAPLQI